MDSKQPKKPSSDQEDEPKLAKLVQSTDLEQPVEAWKLTSFAEDENKSAMQNLSAEVLEKMQLAMQPEVEQQAELIKKEAYEKAFQQGYDEGLEKGLNEGKTSGEAEARAQIQTALEPKLEQFDAVLQSLKKPYELIESKLYSELVELAVHVAETVVSKSIAENREWIIESVNKAVAKLPDSESDISVFLNPQDLAFIQISKPNSFEKWKLNENANIPVGSCIVKQDHSSVINDWKARFTEISEQLIEEVSEVRNNEVVESSGMTDNDIRMQKSQASEKSSQEG